MERTEVDLVRRDSDNINTLDSDEEFRLSTTTRVAHEERKNNTI